MMRTLLLSPDIDAVIFDIDGTLIDTVDMHAEAWQRTFAKYGREIPFEDVRAQIGKGGDQLLPVFLSQSEIEKFGEQLEKERGELFKAEYLPHVKPFPCSREIFVRLLENGKSVGLASSAKGDELAAYKKIAQIDDLIEEEVSSDDAEKSKPHPDIFEAALEKLGLTPERAVVIGDTPYDAEASRKAGSPVIGVLSGGFPEDGLREAGCSEVWQDIAALVVELKD